jgi:hypothetical protein
MLTKAQKENYLAKGGVFCPYCGSNDISAGEFDGEGDCQSVTCFNCHKNWRDVYKLVDIEEEKQEDQSANINSSLNRLLLLPLYREQGFSVDQEGDDILILRRKGKEIARFSQKGATINSVLEVVVKEINQN